MSEKEQQVAKAETKIAQKTTDAEQAAARNAAARVEVDNLEKRQSELNSKLEATSKKMEQCNKSKMELKNKIRELRRPLHQH